MPRQLTDHVFDGGLVGQFGRQHLNQDGLASISLVGEPCHPLVHHFPAQTVGARRGGSHRPGHQLHFTARTHVGRQVIAVLDSCRHLSIVGIKPAGAQAEGLSAAVIPRHGTSVAQAKEDFHGITGHEGSWRVLRQEGSPVLRLHRDGPAVVIHQRVAEVLDDTRPLLDIPH